MKNRAAQLSSQTVKCFSSKQPSLHFVAHMHCTFPGHPIECEKDWTRGLSSDDINVTASARIVLGEMHYFSLKCTAMKTIMNIVEFGAGFSPKHQHFYLLLRLYHQANVRQQ